MNDERFQELENLPIDQRSPLEQYRELILRWRRQGRAYRWICRMMKEKCGVAVAYGPLYRFVKRRSRPRKAITDLPATIAKQPPLITPPVKVSPSSSTASTDPYAEARERMRRLKEEPAPHKPEKLFHYTEQDSIDPLVLIPQTKEEK